MASKPIKPTEAHARLVQYLFDESGIVVPPGKEWLLETRLGPILKRTRLPDLEALSQKLRLRSDTALRTSVIDAMTTNETSFFRDHHVFDALSDNVLPDLLARGRPRRRLRIWSAACSTGQEPYSLAILLRLHAPEVANWDVEILATDLSTEALATAKAGVYRRHEVGRGLTEAEQQRFLVQHSDRSWIIAPAVKKMVRFAPLNLVKDAAPAGPWDLVLLRNVLIYFDEPTRHHVLAKVHGVMGEGVPLVLGSTESASSFPQDCFERVDIGRTLMFRALQRRAA